MTARRLSVVMIPGRSMGALDAFLPLVLRFAKKNRGGRLRVDTVIVADAIQTMVESSAFHADTLRAMTVYHLLRTPSWLGRLSRVWKFVALFCLLGRRRLQGRVIVLSGIDGRSFADRCFQWLLGLFGDSFWFPNNQIGFTPEFSRRFDDEIWALLKVHGAKDADHPKLKVDQALCYREVEIPVLRPRFVPGTRFSAIGTPKLLDEWSAHVAEQASYYVEDELSHMPSSMRSAMIATIVVPAPGFFWFDKPDGCYRAVDEIVEAFTAQMPDCPVLIKTKPQHLHLFEQNLRAKRENVRLTTLGLAVLAGRSQVAFGIQETSGIFDFLVLGVPVIEYGRYTPAWLEVCPGGSAYRDFPGVTHVQSRADLDAAIGRVRVGNLPRADLPALRHYLGDEDRIDAWVSSLAGRQPMAAV
jgi:hypothetical protein